MALTRLELDKFQCGDPECTTPDCGHIWLHGRCHPEQPALVMYDKARGELDIICAVCAKPIATVEVAPTDGVLQLRELVTRQAPEVWARVQNIAWPR
jgi:hypothetical protein